MNVKIKAELVTAFDLKAGELFSAAGPSYWDTALNKGSIGEAVFIRTHSDYRHAPDANDTVYRITIKRDDDKVKTAVNALLEICDGSNWPEDAQSGPRFKAYQEITEQLLEIATDLDHD